MKGLAFAADFMTILFVCFSFIVTLLMGMVNQEHARQVELLNRKKPVEQLVDQPGSGDLYLTVTKDAHYFLSGKSLSQERKFTDPKAVRLVLEELNPAKLYLRIDKELPHGQALSLHADCSDLGIMAFEMQTM